MLKYTSLATLKAFLWITGTDQDVELQALIDTGTDLLDLDLGENLGEATKTRRIDGTGTNRFVLERIPSDVDSVSITYDNGYSWSPVTLAPDPIEDYTVYTASILPKGTRNVKVTYTVGYTSVPSDLEDFFLHYVQTLKTTREAIAAGRDPFQKVKSKKIEGLQVTYFSPSELSDGLGQSDPFTPKYDAVVQKYRIFSFYATR